MRLSNAVLAIAFVVFSLAKPTYSLAENTYRPKSPQIYITGPKGGCYYINKNGKKTYVDRSLCSKK
jgi:hypothetical protein